MVSLQKHSTLNTLQLRYIAGSAGGELAKSDLSVLLLQYSLIGNADAS